MNDQKQLFLAKNQNFKLKENSQLILSFLNEVSENLEKSLDKFNKDQNLKDFAAYIKENFGNIFDSNQIQSFSKMDKQNVSKTVASSFENRRLERINALGEEQNAEIEKRIFLQILDFLWRSHLQYLEQLRQVVGLRSYGQKDPLAEFRKEAFELFENLLLKIKVETIKFLFNVNIVVERDENRLNNNTSTFERKKKIPRNSPCTCGSGKKYKFCCGRVA